MSATTIRAKDWIFNAIWAASGERGAPKCYITIPITFIFKNGKPIKALATDRNGVVERVSLESVEEERTDRERGFRGENFRTIRAFRKLLIQFSDTNRYGEYQYNEAEILICKVFKFLNDING